MSEPEHGASGAPAGNQEGVPSGLDAFAEVWAGVVAETSYVQMDTGEIATHLRGLASSLAHALFAEPFQAGPAQQVGAVLVATHFTGTDTLERTVALLGEGLLPRLAVDTPELRARLARLQGGLASGYAQALQRQTLAEQEDIRQAGLVVRQQAENALRASEARFRAVFAGAPVGIGIGDPWGRIFDANQTLSDMLGYSIAELREHAVTDFVHPDDLPDLLETYRILAEGQQDRVRTEIRCRRRDGGVVWTHLALSLVRDDDGEPSLLVVMGEDVSARYHLQTRLRGQALLHDPLTRLPNRVLFFDRLAEVFAGAATGDRVGLCVLDLDGFKAINDGLGYDVGDEVLAVVAARLEQSESPRGHLVAHMGGDEFVILVKDSRSAEEVIEAAERALAALAAPIRIQAHDLSVSASIGVVERPVAGTEPTDLMRAADITLYWAKSGGKARWALFDPERDLREVGRHALSMSMPAALKHQQFTLEYQPVIRLADGVVLSVEALVRWQHPQLGLLNPDRFMPLAEETGLIVPLGRWVLERACRQARMWQDLFPDAPFVSINVAGPQSEDRMLVNDVKRVLAETGLDPGRLQLELSGGAVIGAADEPVGALWELSELGVRIAIDDFGAGYSNLAHLRSLPARELKLAGSFVQRLGLPAEPDSVDEPIVGTLVSLAHMLDLTVTAKRVESPVQAERLRALGCDGAQGWHVAHPGSADEVLRLLDAQQEKPGED
ncbi:MAG: EAL domain-containing protein [Nitriliruptorales bacterium]|nr:EAL domain-containing protein [Nitriliruptorales bacterium]